ncbi:MAG: cell division protein FtsW [Candidatus Doudnabacteria bacterium RIFCSPHIGHO2_01_52_17]|uniref:Probable peptidoglycan glycosyltransferase FtsW n=1 Tax=Candidatus Doudnabacteria bacterium RIFCSPHIGHO2_01_52_17 TaxID=1817820 RepID=A0A1F5NAD2_9BACT|nr:MAG: cell division protein FtsW [Candidatus Doudnabacteria bacterium RIFCSPHIGHO2_01_52_17]
MKQKSLKKPTDRLLATVTVALTIVGLAMLSSASAVVSYERFGTNNYYFFRQLIFAAAGLALMYMVSRIDYHFWRRWSRPFLLLILVVLALVLVPSLGVAPGAARSWFQVGSFFVQPSEFAKLVLIFYLASWFERKKGAENNFWFGVLPPLLMAGLVIALVAMQPDIGTAVILATVVFLLFFAADVKYAYLGAFGAFGLAALWIAVKVAPYRSARILTFLDPTKDPLGIGYHISQALLAIGSGGIWGYGFGASRQKYNYLPEPIGDSIFAVMAEELGFLRVVAAVLLFGIFIWAGLRVARHAPDRFGQLAGIGITAWIGFQAFLNIAAISGILPLTGVTLPFISYGGSSLVVALLGAGVLLNISRQRL